MEYKNFLYTKENGIGIMTMNRPDVLNAFSYESFGETAQCFTEIAADPEVKVFVIRGTNNVFAAGADIRNLIEYNPLQAAKFLERAQASMLSIANMNKPTIASIGGFCLGGGLELALACDFRIAGDNAVFGLPEINLGILPAGGGTQRLTKFIGCGRAKEIMFLGEMFNAQKALDLGLLYQMVPIAELEEKTMKLAKKLSFKPPLAIRALKELTQVSLDVDIFTGLMMEKEKFANLFSSKDQVEGMTAFAENRKANFIGE
ncbi:MAG TPA: enoyl-CoA hydratase/isomerase family protein [Syntrophomonadaceae bacterium]|nr:enoyl-CoA hydratase/isomerase family protein [Syntrophomonadaceae bacterium]HPR93711.1 enoyl-CoA hydratase/isomerase family protein [Syntrophomonadaceae bacterium]